jgi:hypothetical protein
MGMGVQDFQDFVEILRFHECQAKSRIWQQVVGPGFWLACRMSVVF